MTSLSVLLKQIKEKEEQDLAYAKKIKEVEGLLKTEKDKLKKLKSKQKSLLGEIKRKTLGCSSEKITRLELLHQKQIWEDLLQELQITLSQSEANLDELQQSICLSRLSFYNEQRGFLERYKFLNDFDGNIKKACSLTLTDMEENRDQDNGSDEHLAILLPILQNQLDELKTEKVRMEEAKVWKGKLEAEPSCGKEFLKYQNMLLEAKDKLARAEKEETYLKTMIAQNDVLLLKKKSLSHKDKDCVISVIGNEENDSLLPTKTEVGKNMIAQESLTLSKSVTFNGTVEMKTISPPLQCQVVSKSKTRKSKLPSAALKIKLTKSLTRTQLDQNMRDILFKDQMYN